LTYYPVFLDIDGKKCIVVGGGTIALRKVEVLLDCGAEVGVVSPKLHPKLVKLAKAGTINVINREYREGDLKDAFIVIAATDVKQVNQKVAKEAKRKGILINVIDSTEGSDFIFPSFLRRGDLTIAVSTAGSSPALARKIKTRIEEIFGEEYSLLLSLVKEVRTILRRQGVVVNSDVWQETLDLDLLIELLKADQWEKAKSLLLRNLKANG